jgi:tRNA(Ile)-lysidine synthase
MESKTREALSEMIIKEKEGSLEFEAQSLRTLAPPIVGHLIRTAIEMVKGNLAELSFSHINSIVKNLDSTERWELHLPDEIYVVGTKNNLIITKEKPQEPQKISFHYTLPVPGSVVIEEAKVQITSEILEDAKTLNESPNNAYLDYEETGKEIVVRSRKDGDRFFPLGMKGAKKLQDFFVDQKIQLNDRDLVPVIEAGERIVWVAPHRIDERNKVTKKTKKVIKLTYQKL